MCICIVIDTVWKEIDIVGSSITMILYPSEIELQKMFKAELYHSNLQ